MTENVKVTLGGVFLFDGDSRPVEFFEANIGAKIILSKGMTMYWKAAWGKFTKCDATLPEQVT
eukprot:3208316-Amphidinium_carterae.1